MTHADDWIEVHRLTSGDGKRYVSIQKRGGQFWRFVGSTEKVEEWPTGTYWSDDPSGFYDDESQVLRDAQAWLKD